MTLKLDRAEVCRLMLALTMAHISSPSTAKWKDLHDKIEEQVRDFDRKVAQHE